MEGTGCPYREGDKATKMSESPHTNSPVLQSFIYVIIS